MCQGLVIYFVRATIRDYVGLRKIYGTCSSFLRQLRSYRIFPRSNGDTKALGLKKQRPKQKAPYRNKTVGQMALKRLLPHAFHFRVDKKFLLSVS